MNVRLRSPSLSQVLWLRLLTIFKGRCLTKKEIIDQNRYLTPPSPVRKGYPYTHSQITNTLLFCYSSSKYLSTLD